MSSSNITVWVAAFEPGPDDCVGGFEWRYNRKDALAVYDAWRTDTNMRAADLYFFPFETDLGEAADVTTQAIDNSLGEACANAAVSRKGHKAW